MGNGEQSEQKWGRLSLDDKEFRSGCFFDGWDLCLQTFAGPFQGCDSSLLKTFSLTQAYMFKSRLTQFIQHLRTNLEMNV